MEKEDLSAALSSSLMDGKRGKDESHVRIIVGRGVLVSWARGLGASSLPEGELPPPSLLLSDAVQEDETPGSEDTKALGFGETQGEVSGEN
jgi:hypothetical protein